MMSKDHDEPKKCQIELGVMLAKSYEPADAERCIGWLCSYKLDGIRGYWSPNDKKMFSRNAKEFQLPKFFTEDFPNITLDGEIYAGLKNFAATGLIRRKVPVDKEWIDAKIKYMVFDGPHLKGNFAERINTLKEICKDCKYITVVDQWVSKNQEQVYEDLAKAEAGNHEGLMLRDPKSAYERKRSKYLLKVKSTYECESRITGYQEGTGKYTGMLGAYECVFLESQKPDDGAPKPKAGIAFTVGSGLNDEQRKNPLEIGTIITIKYSEVQVSGTVRFPIYKGPRFDLTGSGTGSGGLVEES